MQKWIMDYALRLSAAWGILVIVKYLVENDKPL
jgi:hypothetical protein